MISILIAIDCTICWFQILQMKFEFILIMLSNFPKYFVQSSPLILFYKLWKRKQRSIFIRLKLKVLSSKNGWPNRGFSLIHSKKNDSSNSNSFWKCINWIICEISLIWISCLVILFCSSNFKLKQGKIQKMIVLETKKCYGPMLECGNIVMIRVGCERESDNQVRSYDQKSINISDCSFLRSSLYSGNGAIIYASGGTYTIYVSFSMFFNCACSFEGGSIYFSSLLSSLRMVCANKCYSSSQYHFAYLKASQKNQGEFISILNCSHLYGGYYSMQFNSGNQKIGSTNSSMNHALRYSGIGIISPLTFSCSFCTFTDNQVTEYTCLYLSFNSGFLSFANIVANNSPSSEYGILLILGTEPKIQNCIFKRNQNTLFCVFSGSLEISHSIISHLDGLFSISKTISTYNNNSIDLSTGNMNWETYILKLFNSFHCNADNPVITPIQVITYNHIWYYTNSNAIPMILSIIILF